MRVSRAMTSAAALVALGIAVSGCSKPKADRVVAKVGRDPITDMEIASRLQRLPASYQEVVRTPDGQKEFIDSIVRERLVLQKAHELGVDKRPEVKERLDRARKLLERRLEDTLNEVLITETLREIRKSDIGVTDAEVSAFYDQHADRYSNPVETRASHILVGTEAEALGAIARLKSGAKFDVLAKEISRDPTTAPKGGDLGYYRPGDLVSDFEQAAAALKPGQVSGVVKTQFGYHVIRVAARRPAKSRALKEVDADIRQHLEREKFDRWLAKARIAIPVTIDEAALKQVTQSAFSAPAGAAPSAGPSEPVQP